MVLWWAIKMPYIEYYDIQYAPEWAISTHVFVIINPTWQMDAPPNFGVSMDIRSGL